MPAVSYDAVCQGLIKFHAGFKSTFSMSAGRRQKAPLAQSLLGALLHDWQLAALCCRRLVCCLSFSLSRCTFIALIKSRESYRVLSAVLASESIYEIRLDLFAFTSASDYIESCALCAFFIFIILHACHKMWHTALWYGTTRYAHGSAWHMTESKHKGFHLCKCLDGSVYPPAPVCSAYRLPWSAFAFVRIRIEIFVQSAVYNPSEPMTTSLCLAEETNVI